MGNRIYPIGIQNFEKIRKEGYVYVDKTALMYKLVKSGSYFFLSRPRRFGKSLLISTLEAYFEAKRDLFEGLAVETLEKDWVKRPVLHLDLNIGKYDTPDSLDKILNETLDYWESLYGTRSAETTLALRFAGVVGRAYEQSGERVAILIDEYDKPLLRSFDSQELQHDFRETLTAFYTVLKDADPWLQFVFITGVTKFAQMGIFSNLNQLNDISFDLDYNTLCGMTRAEIEATFSPELEALAVKSNATCRQVMDRLTRQYDGYRFTKDEEFTSMYNPFSVLSALQKRSYGNYWFASGTPTFLVEMLQKTDFDLREMEGIEVNEASLSDDRADINNPIPMIYQSGYLTIKDYDERFRMYTLGFPNEEVKYGFLNFVSPFYTPIAQTDTSFYIGKFIRELESGDVDAFLTRLRCFFAGIPYDLNDRTERHYQTVFYLVFQLMGQFTETEVRSARGRADAVVKTPDYIYVFEFKLNDSAEAALRQIDEKGYLLPYQADGRKVVKVGVAFEKEERNIGEWVIGE